MGEEASLSIFSRGLESRVFATMAFSTYRKLDCARITTRSIVSAYCSLTVLHFSFSWASIYIHLRRYLYSDWQTLR
ncbi:hypothetical protein BDZ45DRAFT_679728 [Acephala macrosclerotiorum]|nr:hypothetical protein BDZ45DRAFT_679728 [Acephala macrosclerotiorum]